MLIAIIVVISLLVGVVGFLIYKITKTPNVGHQQPQYLNNI